MWFASAIADSFDLVSWAMIAADMGGIIRDFSLADNQQNVRFLSSLNRDLKKNDVKQFILSNTGMDKFTLDTVGGIYLSAYAMFVQAYNAFRHCFEILVNDGSNNEQEINAFLELFVSNIELQHIGYRIALLEGIC